MATDRQGGRKGAFAVSGGIGAWFGQASSARGVGFFLFGIPCYVPASFESLQNTHFAVEAGR